MLSTYEQGFIDKCAEYGIDAVKLAQGLTSFDASKDLNVPTTPVSMRKNQAQPPGKYPYARYADSLKKALPGTKR